MRTSPAFLAGALACLLAGCAGLAPSDDDAAPEPRIFATDLHECEAAVGLVPVPAGRFAARLPPGWTLLQTEDVGLPDDPRGDALLGVELARCASGYGGNLSDVSYASYFTLVEPADGARDPDARFHFLKWDVLVQDERLRDALRGEGAPAHDGAVDFGPRVPGAEAFQASLDMNGAHVLRATGPIPSYPDLAGFRFAEYQPLASGAWAVWNATAETTLTVGGMTMDLPPGYAAEVAGGPRAEGYVLVGRASFRDATVTLPPARGE